MYEYIPNGTCSSKINFEIKEGKLYSIGFEDGCEGNLKALGILLEGCDAGEIAKKLKGVFCEDRETSCADQFAIAIARAIEKYI